MQGKIMYMLTFRRGEGALEHDESVFSLVSLETHQRILLKEKKEGVCK